jgi:uncharacterized protein YcbK (DUF882 family)
MRITAHFSSEEFACHDGTAYPMHSMDEEDPRGRDWATTRLEVLCDVLEAIRFEAGELPLTVDSGFRTISYDERLYEASAKDGTVAPAKSSQHPQGRAADIRHARLHPAELFNLILDMYQRGQLPALGGVGLYPNFVHVDVRPNHGHLAIWGGRRPSNIL